MIICTPIAFAGRVDVYFAGSNPGTVAYPGICQIMISRGRQYHCRRSPLHRQPCLLRRKFQKQTKGAEHDGADEGKAVVHGQGVWLRQAEQHEDPGKQGADPVVEPDGGASTYSYDYDDLYRLETAEGSYRGANETPVTH